MVSNELKELMTNIRSSQRYGQGQQKILLAFLSFSYVIVKVKALLDGAKGEKHLAGYIYICIYICSYVCTRLAGIYVSTLLPFFPFVPIVSRGPSTSWVLIHTGESP